MGELFIKVLNISITSTWLILVVLCMRLFLKKLPKWISCLLWGIVAVRMLCPISVESDISFIKNAEPIKTSTIIDGKQKNYLPLHYYIILLTEEGIFSFERMKEEV